MHNTGGGKGEVTKHHAETHFHYY